MKLALTAATLLMATTAAAETLRCEPVFLSEGEHFEAYFIKDTDIKIVSVILSDRKGEYTTVECIDPTWQHCKFETKDDGISIKMQISAAKITGQETPETKFALDALRAAGHEPTHIFKRAFAVVSNLGLEDFGGHWFFSTCEMGEVSMKPNWEPKQ